MVRGRFARLAIATFAIGGVPAVPAFAQSAIAELRADAHATRRLDAGLTGTGVARVFDPDALRESSVDIPPNLIVPPTFRRVVDAMLRGSPTFRRQCLRIANAPRMTIALEWFQPRPAEQMRARTVLSTTADGRRSAKIAIQPLDNPVELIAHEIEHVIEQLDAVDLRTLAAVPTSGVHGCGCRDDAFETIRAIRAGLAAADEVRRHGE